MLAASGLGKADEMLATADLMKMGEMPSAEKIREKSVDLVKLLEEKQY